MTEMQMAALYTITGLVVATNAPANRSKETLDIADLLALLVGTAFWPLVLPTYPFSFRNPFYRP